MRTWIPWEEIEAEWMKEPGFAEGLEQARREFEAELEAEIAIYGTIGNPKPQPPQSPLPVAFARSTPKRKPRAFSAKLKRTRTTAV